MERKKLAETAEGIAANAPPPKPVEEKVGSKGAVGPPAMRNEPKAEEEPPKQPPAEKPAAKAKPAHKPPAKPRQRPSRATLRAQRKAAKAARAPVEVAEADFGETEQTFTINHIRAAGQFVVQAGSLEAALGLLKAYEAISKL